MRSNASLVQRGLRTLHQMWSRCACAAIRSPIALPSHAAAAVPLPRPSATDAATSSPATAPLATAATAAGSISPADPSLYRHVQELLRGRLL